MPNALVTGANRGLGHAVAGDLVRKGFTVWGAARDPAAAAPIEGVRYLVLDVADPDSIADLVRGARETFGTLDLLVNNAAIYDGSREDVLATNVIGPVALADGLADVLADGGAVTFVSSGMGELSGASAALRKAALAPDLDRAGLLRLIEGPGWPSHAYSASKCMLNAWVRVLSRELTPRRIRVNAVCPGWVRTDMGGAGAPRSVEQGTRSIVATALATEVTGGFFRDGRAISW